MSQLVPPHNSEQVKPLLLPETERAEERKRSEKLRKIPLELTHGLRRPDAGNGGLYAARWVYGA